MAFKLCMSTTPLFLTPFMLLKHTRIAITPLKTLTETDNIHTQPKKACVKNIGGKNLK